MKKLLTFAASICVAALMFTGCPSVHSELEPKIDLSTATICGSMEDWKGSALTDNGDGTWAYKFIARGDQENFALRGSNSWGVDYRSADGSTLLPEYKMDEEMELVPFNSPDCPPLKGLVIGDEYTITVVPGSTAVKMTIAHTGSNIPSLYVLDENAGPVKIEYDGKQYKYPTVKATSDTISLQVWVNDTYLKGTYAFGAKDAANLTIENKIATLDITGVTSGKEYNVYITYDGKTAKAKAELALPKVYLAGQDPFKWDLGKGTAVKANIVGETSWYYYTFEAKSASLDFKVALADAWSDAYSNNTDKTLPNKTVVDAAPVEFSYANKENAQITGLEVGKKYTLLIDISTGKPAVSVITGEDILFAIGNDDFGGWQWNSCKTMTPTGAGEWKYEFKATKADAQFKFQTKCGKWIDAAQLGANATLSLGGEYIDLVNEGGATPNIKASLTVGTDYVVSVKKSGDKYQVKIAAK